MSSTKDSPDLSLNFVEIAKPRLWMTMAYDNSYVGNAKPAALLNVEAPLTGWYDLGNPMAVRVPVTKDVFEYKQGIPKTSRKQWEIGRTSQITFNTAELTPYVEAFILGQSVFNTFDASISPDRIASLYGRSREKAALGSDGAQYAIDDLVVIASPNVAGLATSFKYAVVESLTASVLTLADSGFPVVMAQNDQIKKVDTVEFIDYMGADTVRSAILFWDTFVDSSGTIKLQNVMYFPKVRNFAGGELDFKDGAEPYDMAITLTAFAVNMTYGDGSTGYNFYKKWVFQY